ncbi:MAG: hypothetical protein ISS78_03160 [Phycisphaerae bacterium]|nr:hypothetical protein [Phycisphaerae bacterium]
MNDAANETRPPESATPAASLAGRIGTDEELITLTEAAKCVPKVDGKKPAVCTLWRWCRIGLRGVLLEYVRVGLFTKKFHKTMTVQARFGNKIGQHLLPIWGREKGRGVVSSLATRP